LDEIIGNVGHLLERVKSVNSADDFWNCQVELRERLLKLESLIRKRRTQYKYFKEAKLSYTRGERKELTRIHQFDELIDQILSSESRLINAIGATKYLGDTLAFNFLPSHVIKVLSYNEEPGFLLGKTGSDHEFEIARQMHEYGYPVFVNDLSHSLRIGDLVVYAKSGINLIECKQSHFEKRRFKKDKFGRQVKRMELATKVLAKEDMPIHEILEDDSPPNEFPSTFIEPDIELSFLPEQLIKACDLKDKSYVAINPEPGLHYIGVRKDTDPSAWISSIKPGFENRGILVGLLQSRMQGTAHFVDPVVLLDIPNSLLIELLLGETLFCTIIDLDYVLEYLSEHGLEVSVRHDEQYGLQSIVVEVEDPDVRFEVGGSLLLKVQYGALSLQSALDIMIDSYRQFRRAVSRIDDAVETGQSNNNA